VYTTHAPLLSDQRHRHRRRHVVSPRVYIYVPASNSAATFQLLFVFRFYDDVLFYFPPRIVRRFYPPLRRHRPRFFHRPSHPSREDYAARVDIYYCYKTTMYFLRPSMYIYVYIILYFSAEEFRENKERKN